MPPNYSNQLRNTIEKLRGRLLDLTGRNPSISFRHKNSSRTQLRVIDEVPDQLFSRLLSIKDFEIRGIPIPDLEPLDEKETNFQKLLKSAKKSDTHYMAALEQLGDEPTRKQLRTIENELRDRLRLKLNLSKVDRESRPPVKLEAEKLGLNPAFELPAIRRRRVHNDDVLQTLHYNDELDLVLSSLSQHADLIESETGTLPLYLAIGFLEWYESENSDKALNSPLILFPVEIRKEKGKQQDRYFLCAREAEPIPNLSLIERMSRDFGIQIPALTHPTDDSEFLNPTAYFKKVQEAISNNRDWKIHNWATVSLLSFTKLAMYKELESTSLDKISTDSTPLEGMVFGASQNDKQHTFAPDYDIESTEMHLKVPRLISSADASQISAIIDVLEGKNLVIEGPPGTGKSQTITNMIAALIERGKKVLFVAEKKAALTVVKERLTKAKLSPFCLELHSSKSKRKEVLDSLSTRLKVRKDHSAENTVVDIERKISNIKEELGKYIGSLNQPHPPLGLTVHDILWKLLNTEDQCLEFLHLLKEIRIDGVMDRTKFDLERIEINLRTLSSDFSRYILPFGHFTNHPWAGLIPANKITPEIESFARDLEVIHQKLLEIKQHSSILNRNFFSNKTLNDIDSSFEILKTLGKYSHSDFSWAIPLLNTFGNKLAQALREVSQVKDNLNTIKEAINRKAPGIVSNKITAGQFTVHIDAIKKQSLGHHDRASLIQSITELEISRQNIESALTVFHQIMGIIDIKLSLNFNNLTKLYSLCKVLATCPVQKWHLMNEDLLFGDSNLKARNIMQRGIGLKKVRSKLQGRCDLDRARLLPLKEISAILANSNLFSWLWPKYRKARKDAQSIIKMQFNDQTYSFELQNAIDYLSEEAAFLEEPSVNQMFPTEHFDGIDSDFEGLESWLKYYSALTEWFQHSGMDPQVFNKITALDKNSIMELRKYAFSVSEPSGDKENEIEHGKYLLDERLNIITKKHKLNSEILDFLKSIDVDTSFKCEFLDALATDVILFERLTKQLSSGICRTVLEQCPAFDDIFDRGLFDSLNEITGAFDILGLSNEEAKTLLDGRFQDWFYQAKQTHLHLIEIKRHIIDRINKNNAQALNIESTPLEQITGKIENALKHKSHATGYLEFLQSLESVQNEGLDTFLITLLENRDLSQRLDVAFRFVFYNSLVLEFYKTYPKLFRSVGSKFNEYRINYSDLDDRLMLAYQSLLSTKLCSRDVPEGVGTGRKKEYTELSLIQHLTTLERPNVSVRELLGRSKNAIQSLKPVFLMSPLSVAQLLPSEIKFDVVIMDEASQMKPEDAIGSIARSAQVIVVGDPKQMPPSDYFSKSADDEDENEEDFIEIKQESILDLALGSFRNPRRLKWHYRSRSEELIAFSNYHFYEKDLIIFPSAKTSDHAQGVMLEEVKGIYGAGLNHIEAQATVDRAICLIKQRPTASMMIVAMNQKQSELINDLLTEREKDDPVLEKYRDYWKNSLEPLLVRNLENVQGDERDIVLISTVYGPDSNGHVFQRFGPIGSEYGHRRLNVLYTRAKELMWVMTSLDDGRIEASHTSSRGVLAFKNFLNYARTKKLGTEVTSYDQRPPDSDFELHVAQKIKQQMPNLDVVAQVGVAGFFIDLAIKHPTKEGAFLIGIECDGKAYHSSKSARDRDKIRQKILEDLGWNLHRIWSTDWFSNADGEIKKLIAKVHSLLGSS